ncbi:MAG: hypothetical protein D3906_16285, partial [Candidatus Electrothrix sp. AUS1_2]|nr:hypothetical protein [Candidatus Electrothrix sp. AUS1_2]
MGYEEALRRIKDKKMIQLDLDLNNQELTKLPPELFQLSDLLSLHLIDNQLTSLPSEIGQLTNLLDLHLTANQLALLPPEIGQLINLRELDLNANQLASLPPELFALKNLTKLYLFGNQLTELPSEIVQLTNLKELDLDDNPLISPPLEIAKQGMDAIRSYFADLEGGSRLLAEVKVILVGEGASGKTSLTRCLRGEPFNPKEDTTHGIRIKKWRISGAVRPIRCNLWDFGGQEIMRATHQFFLSRRSLYVLVLDGRRDEQPEYWLRYIESFGGGSPVLVVL